MLKSTKRFTLTSEAPNAYGFRVLTNGIDLSLFRSNPVMLWMHLRAASGHKNEVLPLGYWADIEINDGKITAVPVFDDKDAFAVSIYNKVENGTLRMASAGLMPLQWDEKASSKALTKSILKEASIVDIGANPDALAVALYDAQGKLINLADYSSLATGSNPAIKTWQELWHSGELEQLKVTNPLLYCQKYQQHFGKLPNLKQA
ncbi:MAG: hypothetical protein ACO1OF_13980 [Adhaeribacter sp.]